MKIYDFSEGQAIDYHGSDHVFKPLPEDLFPDDAQLSSREISDKVHWVRTAVERDERKRDTFGSVDIEYSAALRAYELVVVRQYKTAPPEAGFQGLFTRSSCSRVRPDAEFWQRCVDEVASSFAAYEAQRV